MSEIEKLEQELKVARQKARDADIAAYAVRQRLDEARLKKANADLEGQGIVWGRTVLESTSGMRFGLGQRGRRAVAVRAALDKYSNLPGVVVALLNKDGKPGKRQGEFYRWDIVGELDGDGE